MNYLGLDDFILDALREDIGTGDITTECCVPETEQSRAVLRCKEAGVVCGLDVAKRVFFLLDPSVIFTPHGRRGNGCGGGRRSGHRFRPLPEHPLR